MSKNFNRDILKRAYYLMCTARAMSNIYEENTSVTSKYVHATSKGHEAIQLAVGLQLTENDWVSPYYRDDSILLGIGMKPYELMLQLLCKKDDPFSGGRTYYSHPSLKREGYPKIPHQSSEKYHLKRGYCCQSNCKHCPFKKNDKKKRDEKY